jgi:putative protein-disulfide isomerase
MKLIYIGDPMCSWCYGFGKELSEVMQSLPELRLEIVVGGLRAGATDVLDDAGKRFRLAHWARVEEASGLPFNRDALLARENFVYDTEPICRVVTEALARAGHALDGAQVRQAFEADATRAQTAAEFVKARGWGITSFPALLLDEDGALHTVSPGYASAQELRQRLQRLRAAA